VEKNMAARYIISVDLGGTKILAALVNSKNQIIHRVKIPTEIKKGRNYLVQSIAQSVRKILDEKELTESQIQAICLGVPGTVNPFTGVISRAPNLGIINFNIKQALAKKFKIPVLIENDVNLAGLGILHFELDKKAKNALVVFVGTGIGGAFFFDRKIYRGSSFFAGEIGHMLIDNSGNIALDDKLSSVELNASRTSVVREIKKDLAKNKRSLLKEYKSPKKTLKSKVLAEAIKKNDAIAVKYVSKAAKTIGTVLGSVTTLLNIDTIVLGGGVIEAMHKFMVPKIKSAFKDAVLPEPGKFVTIHATKLGDDAAIYGGIALADEFLKK
jgi:glucokinase